MKQDDLRQRLGPARQPADHDGARPGDPRPRRSTSIFRTTTSTSRPRASATASAPTATTTTCSGKNGVDGIKTGYINASGYNLMTAARTDGKHIVVIGFGFNKAGSRDAKVRELVNKYLPKARSGSYLDVAMIPEPGRKGSTCGSGATRAGRLGAGADADAQLPRRRERADGRGAGRSADRHRRRRHGRHALRASRPHLPGVRWISTCLAAIAAVEDAAPSRPHDTGRGGRCVHRRLSWRAAGAARHHAAPLRPSCRPSASAKVASRST